MSNLKRPSGVDNNSMPLNSVSAVTGGNGVAVKLAFNPRREKLNIPGEVPIPVEPVNDLTPTPSVVTANAKTGGNGVSVKLAFNPRREKLATSEDGTPRTKVSKRGSERERNKVEKERRDRLNAYLGELARMVPIIMGTSKKMDKTSILRLTVAYLRIHHDLLKGSTSNIKWHPEFLKYENLAGLLLESLGGFLFVVSRRGLLTFTTDTITKLLGHVMVDILGHPVYDLVHPEDHEIIRDQFRKQHVEDMDTENGKSPPSGHRSFYIKMLNVTNRQVSKYEHVHVVGHLKTVPPLQAKNPASESDVCLVAVGKLVSQEPIKELYPIMDSERNQWLTRHAIDGKITYSDPRGAWLTGFLPAESIGFSPYSLLHPDDIGVVVAVHNLFLSTGNVPVTVFRMFTKSREILYVKTNTNMVVDMWTSKPRFIISINEVLPEAEGLKLLDAQRNKLLAVTNSAASLSITDNSEQPPGLDHDDNLSLASGYSGNNGYIPRTPSPGSNGSSPRALPIPDMETVDSSQVNVVVGDQKFAIDLSQKEKFRSKPDRANRKALYDQYTHLDKRQDCIPLVKPMFLGGEDTDSSADTDTAGSSTETDVEMTSLRTSPEQYCESPNTCWSPQSHSTDYCGSGYSTSPLNNASGLYSNSPAPSSSALNPPVINPRLPPATQSLVTNYQSSDMVDFNAQESTQTSTQQLPYLSRVPQEEVTGQLRHQITMAQDQTANTSCETAQLLQQEAMRQGETAQLTSGKMPDTIQSPMASTSCSAFAPDRDLDILAQPNREKTGVHIPALDKSKNVLLLELLNKKPTKSKRVISTGHTGSRDVAKSPKELSKVKKQVIPDDADIKDGDQATKGILGQLSQGAVNSSIPLRQPLVPSLPPETAKCILQQDSPQETASPTLAADKSRVDVSQQLQVQYQQLQKSLQSQQQQLSSLKQKMEEQLGSVAPAACTQQQDQLVLLQQLEAKRETHERALRNLKEQYMNHVQQLYNNKKLPARPTAKTTSNHGNKKKRDKPVTLGSNSNEKCQSQFRTINTPKNTVDLTQVVDLTPKGDTSAASVSIAASSNLHGVPTMSTLKHILPRGSQQLQLDTASPGGGAVDAGAVTLSTAATDLANVKVTSSQTYYVLSNASTAGTGHLSTNPPTNGHVVRSLPEYIIITNKPEGVSTQVESNSPMQSVAKQAPIIPNSNNIVCVQTSNSNPGVSTDVGSLIPDTSNLYSAAIRADMSTHQMTGTSLGSSTLQTSGIQTVTTVGNISGITPITSFPVSSTSSSGVRIGSSVPSAFTLTSAGIESITSYIDTPAVTSTPIVESAPSASVTYTTGRGSTSSYHHGCASVLHAKPAALDALTALSSTASTSLTASGLETRDPPQPPQTSSLASHIQTALLSTKLPNHSVATNVPSTAKSQGHKMPGTNGMSDRGVKSQMLRKLLLEYKDAQRANTETEKESVTTVGCACASNETKTPPADNNMSSPSDDILDFVTSNILSKLDNISVENLNDIDFLDLCLDS